MMRKWTAVAMEVADFIVKDQDPLVGYVLKLTYIFG